MQPASKVVTIPARLEPVDIDVSQTAVIVVDMQNAYASRGGYLDLLGMDISGADAVIRAIGRVLPPSRAVGMPVVSVLTRGGPTHSTEVLASWAFTRGIGGGDIGQGAYSGPKRQRLRFRTRCAAINLRTLLKHGLTRRGGVWALA